VALGVMFSGSTTSSISAPEVELAARVKASAKLAVSVIFSA